MLVLLFLAFGVVASEPTFKKCKVSDDECIRNSAEQFMPYFAAGLPKYNVAVLDPHKTDKLDFSYLGLKYLLTNIVKTGLKTCKVSKLTISDSILDSVMVCDMNVTADYDIDGKLLLIPIRSQGKANILLPKMEVSSKTSLTEYIGNDGKKYWALNNFNHEFKLLDKATIKMDSLYDVNSIIGKSINQLFNYYANDVVYDKLPPVINSMIEVSDKAINKFFEANPIDDLIE